MYTQLLSSTNIQKFEPQEPDRWYDMKELIERMKELERENRQPIPYRIPERPCLHKQCPNCHGSGYGRMGTCIHMISCPCPSCSPTM